VLCIIYHSLNEALKDYKEKMCPPKDLTVNGTTTNYAETLVFTGL
jgi:hypothetical protein